MSNEWSSFFYAHHTQWKTRERHINRWEWVRCCCVRNTGSNQLFTKKRLLFILPLYCFRIKCKQAVCLMFAAHKGTDNKKMIFHPIYTLIYRIHFNDLFLFIFFYSWIFLCVVYTRTQVYVHLVYIVTHNTYIIYLYNNLMSTHK